MRLFAAAITVGTIYSAGYSSEKLWAQSDLGANAPGDGSNSFANVEILKQREKQIDRYFGGVEQDMQVTLHDSRTLGEFTPELKGFETSSRLHYNDAEWHWSSLSNERGTIELWGTPFMALDQDQDFQSLDIQLRKFVDENFEIFKVKSPELRFEPALTHYSGPFRYITYSRFVRVQDTPYPVDGAFVTFRFKFNRLIQITNYSFGEVNADSSPTISAEDAIEAATQDSAFDPNKDRVVGKVKTKLQPFYAPSGEISFRFVYDVLIRKTFPRGIWKYSVNGVDGRIVRLENKLYSTGQAMAEVYPRLPSDPIATFPLPNIMVKNGNDKEMAQDDGTFNLDPENAIAVLAGPRVVVKESGSAPVNATGTSSGILFKAADHISENMAYVHVNKVNAFVRNFLHSAVNQIAGGRTFDFLNQPIVVNTRMNSEQMPECNAWFDPEMGTLNFLEESARCRASSHFADVIYHEWGHALDNSLGGIQDGAFSEGIGDTVSMLMTNDPRLGIGFIKATPDKPIRDISVVKHYPENRDRDPHKESLIISGAWYEFTQMMKKVYGDDDGRMKAAEIFFKHMVSTKHYLDSYEGALVVDDDNGNLEDCTPHMCLLNLAFSRRGLTEPDPRCMSKLEGVDEVNTGRQACGATTIPVPQ